MFVVCVAVSVKPEFVQQFIEATMDNARNSRREAGNLRFDVLQTEEDPARFTLYEAYHTAKDFERHQQTDHYARWKAAVTPWMAEPRKALKHRALFFGEDEA
jgi:autoinducer 2-degrading protein